jgi:hypothetical protein
MYDDIEAPIALVEGPGRHGRAIADSASGPWNDPNEHVDAAPHGVGVPAEQRTRLPICHIDPVRCWKLSRTDIESVDR